MKRILYITVMASIFSPVVVSAAPKVDRGNGSFFSKPGATAEIAASDIATCRNIAEGTDSQIKAVNVVMGGLGAVIGGAFAGGRQKRVNIENCMLVRGWNLYAMTREEGTAWKALPEADRNRELAALVGVTAPPRGTLLRSWHNDYAEPVLWQKD